MKLFPRSNCRNIESAPDSCFIAVPLDTRPGTNAIRPDIIAEAGPGIWPARAAALEPSAGRLIPAADLRADAAILRQAYETLHPGMYRYRSKADIDAAFGTLDGDFARPRTLAEAYLAIARLTTYVQCGHTYPNFFNQGEAVARVVLGHPVVPFEFRWLDRRMVVTRSYLDTADLVPGTEVLSIDGRPVADILVALLPYSRADGGNDATRVSNLAVQGHGAYEAFDVYFPLVFPRDERRPFALQVRGPTGGNQHGITGGAFFFLRLPKSGIEADVPLIGQFPVSTDPLPDAGLEPDVRVATAAADIAAGRDPELEEVLRRIAAARQSGE